MIEGAVSTPFKILIYLEKIYNRCLHVSLYKDFNSEFAFHHAHMKIITLLKEIIDLSIDDNTIIRKVSECGQMDVVNLLLWKIAGKLILRCETALHLIGIPKDVIGIIQNYIGVLEIYQ